MAETRLFSSGVTKTPDSLLVSKFLQCNELVTHARDKSSTVISKTLLVTKVVTKHDVLFSYYFPISST